MNSSTLTGLAAIVYHLKKGQDNGELSCDALAEFLSSIVINKSEKPFGFTKSDMEEMVKLYGEIWSKHAKEFEERQEGWIPVTDEEIESHWFMAGEKNMLEILLSEWDNPMVAMERFQELHKSLTSD